jgi:SAM-dependent methyltransferase
MPDDRAAEFAASFDRAAGVYERARPEYPADAVDWLLPAGARAVLDLGAGTGKLTRALAARGLEVTAVDPAPEMLAELRAAVPTAATLVGAAESIPLGDASVDAVLVAQAWHWVDQAVAVPEVARVLRPGGTLGLVWNLRDEGVPWVKRLTEIMHRSNAEEFLAHPGFVAGPFGPMETAEFAWSKEFDREELLNLVRSRSYIITATEAERARILGEVGELLDTHADLAGTDRWSMPYRTLCFRMSLPPR